jgi:hypothetical protein
LYFSFGKELPKGPFGSGVLEGRGGEGREYRAIFASPKLGGFGGEGNKNII